MKRYLLLFCGLGLLVCLASCGDDPLPAATADFSYQAETENVPEVGVRITFINKSTNFATLKWDFGNGAVSDSISPTIIYEDSDEYIVTLTAITADGQETVTSQDLVVGERIMTSLGIFDIEFTKQDGSPWDPIDSLDSAAKWPDLIFFLGPQNNPNQGNTIVISPSQQGAEFLENLTPDGVPFGFTLNEQGPSFVLTGELWDILFLDDDGDDVDPELMVQASFNPVFLASTIFLDDEGSGVLDISLGGYTIEIQFRIGIPQ